MPTLTRAFTPEVANFDSHYATTTLSVDDLVRHCYAVGYVTASKEDASATSTSDSLTMVSMPTPTTAAVVQQSDPFSTPQYLIDEMLAPDLTIPAAGDEALGESNGMFTDYDSMWPHNTMFSPDNGVSEFNPAAPNNEVEDDGRFHSFQPGEMPVDFDEFLVPQ